MAQASTNEIKPGMKLEIENTPFLVINNEFVKPGKGQAFNRIRMKNILTGKVMEKTYKSGEKLFLADVEETFMRLLYTQQDSAVFMHDETFEQLEVPLETVENASNWLKDDLIYELVLYKGQVVEVVPPTFMELKVTESAPGVKGDTASGRVLKPATLETGARVQIPIFINEGEIIKVDTRDNSYISRVS